MLREPVLDRLYRIAAARICAICSGRSVGSGVKSRALTPLKIVVLPRMPIASVSTATIAKPGCADERADGVPQVLSERRRT